MADRFWIGGTGNWSSSDHWSTTSGGSGGASVPTSADNVYFDAHSFSGAGQTVTVNTNSYFLDMDWTGALYSPKIVNTDGWNCHAYGSVTLISGMTLTDPYKKFFTFQIVVAGKNLTTAGNPIGMLYMNGSGELALADDVTCGKFNFSNGTINTNGKAINCTAVTSNIAATRVLTLGNSIITCSGNISFVSSKLTVTVNAAKFVMTGASMTFAGGGLTYNNLEIQGNNCTITGSNTFNELKVKAGNTAVMTAGTTQTAGKICSDTAGSPATLSCASGTVVVKSAEITDIIASGGAIFNADNCTDGGGNSGWTWLTRLKQMGMSMGMSMGMGL